MAVCMTHSYFLSHPLGPNLEWDEVVSAGHNLVSLLDNVVISMGSFDRDMILMGLVVSLWRQNGLEMLFYCIICMFKHSIWE